LLDGAERLQMSQVSSGASHWLGASKSNRVPTDPDPDFDYFDPDFDSDEHDSAV
jgi:hypothetical protein